MIRIMYDRVRHELIVEGHADHDAKGKDIVCSAVSMLVNTLGRTIKDMKHEKKLKKAYVRIEPGYAELRCKPIKSFKPNLTLILDSSFKTLGALQTGYPECVEAWIREK